MRNGGHVSVQLELQDDLVCAARRGDSSVAEIAEGFGSSGGREDACDVVRPDAVERVLARLLEDSERCDGQLKRADIDRAYAKRDLSIAECVQVEASLDAHGIEVIDDVEMDTSERGEAGPWGRSAQNAAYLSEQEEKVLGRRIQAAARLSEADLIEHPGIAARIANDARLARQAFVTTNVRYVRQLVRRVRHITHLREDDLFQEGVIGLLRATETWDPEAGFRFKTYATWWIRQTMGRAVSNNDRTIRLPVHVQEKLTKLRRAQARLAFISGKTPTTHELAEALGVDAERLARLMWYSHATNCADGDAPLVDDLTLFDVLPDTGAASAFDVVANGDLREAIRSVLEELTPREERIIRLRFGLDGGEPQTLEVIGQAFGVTRERIRQIEEKALLRLQLPDRLRRLRSFIELRAEQADG